MTIHTDAPEGTDMIAQQTWKLVRGTTGLYASPDGRWQCYQRDAAWILRDLSLTRDPREHGRDIERAFYTGAEMLRYLERVSA